MGPKPENLSGQKFHMLTALSKVDKTTRFGTRWLCRCDCGIEKTVMAHNLKCGNTVSCGCHRRSRRFSIHKHGHAKDGQASREYTAWAHAKTRCSNPNDKKWKDYGGRGITMCKEWRESFSAFLSYMGECPPRLTLDRYPNNNGNYEPGNCRWASVHDQNLNRRRLPRSAANSLQT